MSIKLGSTSFSGIYLGSTKIGAAYIGNVKVYSSAPAGAVIGGKTYPTCTLPDGHEWLAVNLDYAWSGLSVPTSGATKVSTPQAQYYNNDETTYGWSGLKYGLLYNNYAVSELETNKATLCPGWHVPTKAEFDALVAAIGSTNGGKLKSTTGWTNAGNGTDDYGFTAYPSGYLGTLGWGGITSAFRMWSRIDGATATNAYVLLLAASTQEISLSAHNRQLQYSIRLIKDY